MQHKPFCFAGQPADCDGYFPGDVLPCICGAQGDLIAALSQVAVSTQFELAPAPAAHVKSEDQAA